MPTYKQTPDNRLEGYVREADYADAYSVLTANTAETPVSLAMATNTVLGRLTGNITDLTGSDIATMIGMTFDGCYDNDSGERTIIVDDGVVEWDITGSYFFSIDCAAASNPSVNGASVPYGFRVINGADAWYVGRLTTDQLLFYGNIQTYNLDLAGNYTVDAGGTISIDSSSTIDWAGTNASLTTAGVLKVGDGAAATPSLSFISDTNTGFYRSGTDEISVAFVGAQKIIMSGVEAYSGTGTATTGAPRIFLGTNAPSGDDSAILIGRNIDGDALFSHAIKDESTFETTSAGGYCSFDSDFSVGGTENYNHLNSFQCRYDFTGSGTLTDAFGFSYNPTLSGPVTAATGFGVYPPGGAGTITNLYGFLMRSGTRNNVTNYYGLYISDVTGPTNKWAIYTNGTNPSYFGGFVGCGDSTPNTILSAYGDKTAPTVFQDASFGQVDICQTGAVNKIMKLSFSSNGYMGNSCAAIGVKTTGAGSFFYIGTTNTGGGLSNTGFELDNNGNVILSGALSVANDLTLTGGGTIDSTANGNINLVPNGTGIVKIGAGSPGHLTPTSGELYVQGKSEFDGDIFFDSTVYAYNDFSIYANNKELRIGSAANTRLDWSTDQTNPGIVWGIGQTSKYLIICGHDDRNYNFARANQTNPTLFIHSANQSTTEWLSLTHNQTDGIITAGTGTIRIPIAAAYTPDAITATSETVAASVATVITEITTNGDADLDDVSLANGVDGQIKIFSIVAVGNVADSVKITPASMVGGTQITFGASPLGLGCIMCYDSGVGGWVVVANNGGVIS